MADEFAGRAAPLTQQGFDKVSGELGGDAASLWALINVETRGFGFFPDKRPKLLFERHQFHKRTAGRYDANNPDISASARGGYLSGTAEYRRLTRAMTLDRRKRPAIPSCPSVISRAAPSDEGETRRSGLPAALAAVPGCPSGRNTDRAR